MKYFLIVFTIAFCFLSNAQVSMQLKVPPIVPGSEVTLEVRINKGAVINFAKYQIDVPAGAYLSEGDIKAGNFTFENNRGKVIWVSIPNEPEFVITLKLNPGTATGEGVINQKFSYLDNGTKKEAEAAPVTVNFSGGPAVVSSEISSPAQNPQQAPPVASESPAVENNSPPPAAAVEPGPEITPKDNTITEVTKEVQVPEVKKEEPPVTKESNAEAIRKLKEQFDAANGQSSTAAEPETAAPSVAKSPAKTAPAAANASPSAVAGLSFRIQIGAYEANPGMARYQSIKGVNISKEDNFYKILVGNFKSREEAVKKKDELLTKGFKGFVVMYQNGKRIK